MHSILFTLLAATSLVSASASGCQLGALESFVSKSSCKCATQLFKCLGAEVDSQQLERIQQCFVQNGCTEAESLRGTAWVSGDCNAGVVFGADGELKKRADKTTSTSGNINPTNTDTSTSSPSTSDASTSTSNPTTTSDATTTSDSTSSVSSASANTVSSTTASEQSQTTSAPTQTTLQCMIDVEVTASTCSYTSAAGKMSKLGCAPTITTTPTCAPGIICQKDSAGDTVCLKRDDHLTTSGVVVTIAFCTAIVSAALAMFIYQMSSRARSKRAEREALLSSGMSKTPQTPYSQQNPTDANIPLMTPNNNNRLDAGYYNEQLDYQPSPADGTAPRLHPGLGALGQSNTYQ